MHKFFEDRVAAAKKAQAKRLTALAKDYVGTAITQGRVTIDCEHVSPDEFKPLIAANSRAATV